MLHTAATGTSGASALMSFPSSSSSASPRWRAAGSLTKPHGTHTTNAVPRRPHEIERQVNVVPRRGVSHVVMGAMNEDGITEGVTLVELEQQLSAAIAREDYSTAAALRDDIGRLRVVSTLAVEKVNAEFYQAFENSDLKAMSNVWGQGDHVQCIHPAAGCIAGRDEVMESWSVVLPSVNFDITIKDVRVHATDSLGFVTCLEIMEGDDNRGRLIATNVFEKQDGRWVMVHHHASPAPRF